MYGSILAQLNDARLPRLLLRLDEDLAREVRQKRCTRRRIRANPAVRWRR